MASEAPTTPAPTVDKPTTSSPAPAPATNGGKGAGKKGAKSDVMAGEGQEPAIAKAKARAAADDSAAEAQTERKDVVPPQYRQAYAATGGTNGDFIAEELTAVTKDGGQASLNAVKKENDVPTERWSSLNNGMQRMNLANTLRARFMRGEEITIGGKRFDLRAQMEEFGTVKADNEGQINKFLKFIGINQTDRMRRAIVALLTPKPDRAAEKAKRDEERAKAKADKAAAKEAEKAEKAKAREAAAAEKATAKKAAADAKTKAASK